VSPAAGHVVLVGLMSSGKTTVGRRLATRLGRPFLDADDVIAERAGRPITAIYAEGGEDAFRAIEAEVMADLLGRDEPTVIAAGGGVVVTAANRDLLADPAVTVVWLDAPPGFLASRARPKSNRPLLHGDVDKRAVFERLHAERVDHFRAVADVVVDVEPFHRDTPEPKAALADRIADLVRDHEGHRSCGPGAARPRVRFARSGGDDRRPAPSGTGTTTVEVRASGRRYPVLVGPGVRSELAALVPAGVSRVAIVSQAAVPLAVDPGVEHRRFDVGDGEEAKTLATVETLCRAWADWGLTRADAVVAVGGGMVTDVAGFAAATYHRGVPVLHVPTTLLGMVDAAIGGKTGVNLPEGKNLVGAFWQPTAVLCDTEALDTLPPRELRSGRGELAKYHFLDDVDLLDLDLVERIAAAVAIKAAVVASDEREDPSNRRGRAILNYGHTLAHALEVETAHDLRHGEAVAVGLAYAAALARRLGRIDDARVAEHHRVLAAYDLDATMPPTADHEHLVALMGRDKKAIDGLTFVLDGPQGVEVVSGVDRSHALAALEDLS
jgi:5-deoxy-5-amino-3-dehydroquinate synthase